jgi:hypothetical protein
VRAQHPLIIVVDNDSGAKPIFGLIKEMTKVSVDINTKSDFFKIIDNIYIIKVPEGVANEERAIESLFDPIVLMTPLHGKTFNPGNKPFDPNKHYGKEPFAQNVIKPNANILNFSGFIPLLDRIVKVIDDF